MNTLDDVLQLWLSKPEFKEHFKENPKAALEEEAIELTDDDFKKILSYLEHKENDSGSGSDEELDKRISK